MVVLFWFPNILNFKFNRLNKHSAVISQWSRRGVPLGVFSGLPFRKYSKQCFQHLVYKTNKALTNTFAGLFMMLSTVLLCFKVEPKGVKSNFFREDLSKTINFSPLKLLVLSHLPNLTVFNR